MCRLTGHARRISGRFDPMELVQHANIVLAHLPLLWHEHGDPGGWWWLWRIGMLFFWFILIGFAFFWFRRWGWGRERSGAERARDILAERYALGEISVEEYRERLSELR